MSDTPEADNERFNGVEDGCGMPDVVTYEFAQKLERERDEAREERDRYKRMWEESRMETVEAAK